MLFLIAKALESYWKYHKNVMELEVLSDNELQDIGLNRSDIPYVAAGKKPKETLDTQPQA